MELVGTAVQWIQDHLLLLFGLDTGRRAWKMFRYQPGDQQVCTTRHIREGRGWPWNRKIAVHPLDSGRVELTPLEAPRSVLRRREKRR